MIIDKLVLAARECGPICVGLDTHPSYVPTKLMQSCATPAEAMFRMNKEIIDATMDLSACYKVQIAYYEAQGLQGLKAYVDTLNYLKEKNKIAIADIKRGDIADTAVQYATAHQKGEFAADFATISPYMGIDTIGPWITDVENHGVFVLVKTSNPGSKDFQLQEGLYGGLFYEKVAAAVNDLAISTQGREGFGAVGAVVGCTDFAEAENVREKMPNTFFLVPGYGAQGGSAQTVAKLSKNGEGLVVNSSRGILLRYRKEAEGEDAFAAASRKACLEMKEDLLNALFA